MKTLDKPIEICYNKYNIILNRGDQHGISQLIQKED
jgi:hypothetical protein